MSSLMENHRQNEYMGDRADGSCSNITLSIFNAHRGGSGKENGDAPKSYLLNTDRNQAKV